MGDLRGACVDGCNVGGCNFRACRVSLTVPRESADGLETADLAGRIDNCHFCGHCGKEREVWGTREGAQAHHRSQHPELSENILPISVEAGCTRIAVARESGQAMWSKGGE